MCVGAMEFAASLMVVWGKDATLSVQAWGTGPLSYQWFDNGIAIPNATNAVLDFPSIHFTNAGVYSVVVSSPLGSVTNTPAQVVVIPPAFRLGCIWHHGQRRGRLHLEPSSAFCRGCTWNQRSCEWKSNESFPRSPPKPSRAPFRTRLVPARPSDSPRAKPKS
jgi:hypothetical protein